jgi:hypothetical protein
MPKYNIVWHRDMELFRKHKFELTKIELEISSPSLKEVLKMAKKKKHKGFYLAGIKRIK